MGMSRVSNFGVEFSTSSVCSSRLTTCFLCFDVDFGLRVLSSLRKQRDILVFQKENKRSGLHFGIDFIYTGAEMGR